MRQEITNAIRWARLYGGSLAVMVVRDGMELSEPLDLEGLSPGAFQGLLVLDRTQGISPSTELETNLDDPDFGEPMWYDADIDTEEERHVRIHHSRVLKFTGRELPRLEMQAEMYWGVSELEHIWDELKKRDAASANIAQLLFQANVTTLKMGKFGEALVTGTAKLPRFELARPERVIGRMTLTNLQSGMYYGYVGLVRNLVRKIRQELGEEAYVVATGGMALMIAEESKAIDKLDGLLTLKGLRLIYERNLPEGGK